MTAITGQMDLSIMGSNGFFDLLLMILSVFIGNSIVCKFPVPSAVAYLRPRRDERYLV